MHNVKNAVNKPGNQLKKLRILQVVARLPSPPTDGGAAYVFHISRELVELGHNVSMAGFLSNKHSQDENLMNGVRLYMRDGEFRPYGLWALIQSELARKPATISHRMSRKNFSRVLDDCKEKVDVILLEGVFVAEFVPQLRVKFPGVPIVLRTSNVEYQILERNAKIMSPLQRVVYLRQARLTKKFEKWAMKQVDGMTAITEQDRVVLQAMNPGIPSMVITAGAYIPEDVKKRLNKGDSDEKASSDRSKIGVIADWTWIPNHTGLAWFIEHVWAKIRAKHPNLRFEVAGKGMPKQLEEVLIKSDINYLGFVDDADVFRSSLDVMVIPLLSGGGMKLKTLDAMASGVPFVSTPIGTEGIHVEDGVHCFIAEKPEEFFQKLDTLLLDDSTRKLLVKNAYDRVQEMYSWHAKAEELSRFIERLVD